MDRPVDQQQIESIYQFCIKKLSANEFSSVFIYKMTDGTLSYQDFKMNLDQAKRYLAKKGWPEALPVRENQTVEVVHAGEVVRDFSKKESNNDFQTV